MDTTAEAAIHTAQRKRKKHNNRAQRSTEASRPQRLSQVLCGLDAINKIKKVTVII
jgi:hypothetical protein